MLHIKNPSEKKHKEIKYYVNIYKDILLGQNIKKSKKKQQNIKQNTSSCCCCRWNVTRFLLTHQHPHEPTKKKSVKNIKEIFKKKNAAKKLKQSNKKATLKTKN